MNRQMTKLVAKSRVHEDEFENAFNNKTVTKMISSQLGKAWLIQNKGHQDKQVLQLWEGGEETINFTTDMQSKAIYNKKNGTNI